MESYMESTDFIGLKRSYDRDRGRDILGLDKVKHDLLDDFEETPAKSSRLTLNTHKNKSYSDFAMPAQNELSLLKKEVNLKDAEIISMRANLMLVENQISHSEDTIRKLHIEHEKVLAKFKSERDRDSENLFKMKSKLHYVMEKEKTSREEIHRLEEELSKLKSESDKKIASAQKEKIDAMDQGKQTGATLFEKECELRKEIVRLENEITRLESKLGESEAQLELRKRIQTENSELSREIENVNRKLAEEKQKNKELEKKLHDHEDNLIITSALKTDLDQVPFMKNELEKLRSDNEQLRRNEQNTLLLEEEVRSLKTKLKLVEANQERIFELEIENEELQGRLHRWEATDTSGSRRPQSPSSLSRRVQDLEMIQANLMLTQGELQSVINLSQRKFEAAQSEIQKISTELQAFKNKEAQQNDFNKRLNRKLMLIKKERDSYKSLLDSYESEVTMNFDSEKISQVQHLEEVILGYKQETAELEAEIDSLSARLTDALAKYDQMQQQLQISGTTSQQPSSRESQDMIRQLQERVAELEIALSKTQEEKDILEARIEQRDLQGDYDPSKIKVLQFMMNPCAIAQKARQLELEKFKEENEKLRKRNQILEEEGNVENITLQVQEKLQHPSPSKELEELKAQLKREETRNKRLLEVFKKTSHEFREVCYQLTGYKLDIPATNQYRLTSMYAESSRDHLLFQQNERGEIQLLQTDFSLTLQDAMETYLQRQNSIPMFLSHITMDLFSKQTMNFD
ncbi:unnamed protein product [Lymnaea stagnalis]|uniref:Mitotic spindle assembly checkpoint protein MAD1 n=1 Tax=Lymnaea stagnalis TaxID=6523 RepID=A0AAV2IA14_LYMST